MPETRNAAATVLLRKGPSGALEVYLARRSEKLTLVFEAGGDFIVPAAQIQWWNMETSAVETESVPAMTVSVAGPPIPSPASEAPPAKPIWPTVVAWGALLAVVLLVLRRHLPQLQSRWAAYQAERRHSQGYAFDKLRKALHGGDPRAVHQALLTWLERIEPGLGARQFARRYGDEKLQRQIEELSRALYSGSGDSGNLRPLEKSLTAARRRRAHVARDRQIFVLPPMNP